MQSRYKKSKALFLCILLSVSLFACNGSGSTDLSGNSPSPSEESENSTKAQNTPDGTEKENGQQEPLLGEDATDEELLEALGDEVNVVTDDDYIAMVTDFKEHLEEHSGKIYQVEGNYHMENGVPYVVRTIVDGGQKTVSGLPLKYLTSESKEGDWIRVTGVINEGELGGEATAVLEVVILQTLEKQGQKELSVG